MAQERERDVAGSNINGDGSLIYVCLLASVAALGGLLFGYDTAVIAGAIDFLEIRFELAAPGKGWAVANVLSEHGWPIETESEVSGSVATEFVLVGVNADRNACSSFVGDDRYIDQLRCKLVVHVRSLSEQETEIHVNALIEGRVVATHSTMGDRVIKWTPCSSTGRIEKEILHAVEVELL